MGRKEVPEASKACFPLGTTTFAFSFFSTSFLAASALSVSFCWALGSIGELVSEMNLLIVNDNISYRIIEFKFG